MKSNLRATCSHRSAKSVLLAIFPLVATLPSWAASENTGNDTAWFGASAGTAGNFNSFFGVSAGDTTTADGNTAVGFYSLTFNTTGAENSAFGTAALGSGTTGSRNVGVGVDAMSYNETGNDNVAVGYESLGGDAVASYSFNTAIGSSALYNNTASYNTAVGYYSLKANTSGTRLVGLGASSLLSNTTGSNSVAIGSAALRANTIGNSNVAAGINTLYKNVAGSNNSAVGANALFSNIGNSNTALGINAGYDLTTGSNNIDIGNRGVAGEGGTIRIGTSGTQTRAFVAGITGVGVTGAAVYVTSGGQLGIQSSSQTTKHNIRAITEKVNPVDQLRPVAFAYNNDPSEATHYGLIAEDVNKVSPELVLHDQDGKIMTVQYIELVPLLLQKVQQQQDEIDQLKAAVNGRDSELADRLTKLEQEIRARNDMAMQ